MSFKFLPTVVPLTKPHKLTINRIHIQLSGTETYPDTETIRLRPKNGKLTGFITVLRNRALQIELTAYTIQPLGEQRIVDYPRQRPIRINVWEGCLPEEAKLITSELYSDMACLEIASMGTRLQVANWVDAIENGDDFSPLPAIAEYPEDYCHWLILDFSNRNGPGKKRTPKPVLPNPSPELIT